MPLEEEQYAPGSRLKSPGGKELTVQDTVQGSSGNQFVLMSEEGQDGVQLIPLAGLRDFDTEWEVAEERDDDQDDDQDDAQDDKKSQERPHDQQSVTDATDVTDSQESSSDKESGEQDSEPSPPSPRRKRS